MARFVKLTGAFEGEAVYINMDTIVSMQRWKIEPGLTALYTTEGTDQHGEGNRRVVRETPEEIIAKLKED